MSRTLCRPVAALAVLTLLSTTGARCGTGRAAGDPRPSAQPPPAATTATAATAANTLVGRPLDGPTGLRLFLPWGWFVDVDADVRRATRATTWLQRPAAGPLLIEEVRRQDVDFGRVEVRPTGPDDALPGAPRVVSLTAPAPATLAASADGNAVWVAEYASRTRCTLREVGLDGRDRRSARPVVCGTRPMAETSHGLWASVGPDAFAAAVSSNDRFDTVLLDPETLREKARFPSAATLVDEDRVLLGDDAWSDSLRLRDMRTGEEVGLRRPTSNGGASVRPVSPDRRYLPFTFESPGSDPQVFDLWLLDLRTMGWLRAPSMPVYAALKATSLAWAADGRLVVLGEFEHVGPVLVTWRPGDPQLALRPYTRPEQRPDQPSTDLFLVL